MRKKILIIGSTGKLGTKLLNICSRNNISVDAITCFNDVKKIEKQSAKYNVKIKFCLSNKYEISLFNKYLSSTKLSLVYILDFGSYSLSYFEFLIKYQRNCIFAVANKEVIIAGGHLLQKKIKDTSNFFIPLDSEHYSLINNNIIQDNINKIFITASGGPFYYNKSINLSEVSLKDVLNHPKWKMGTNNLIDSSNFINKILEIYELSYIFNIDLKKISFLINSEAYIHSIVHFKDHIISINCFLNDMNIPLAKPLTSIFKEISLQKLKDKNYLTTNNLKLDVFEDKRFSIYKYFTYLKKLNHKKQIQFMLLNNRAQSLYLNNKIKYKDLVPFIIRNLKRNYKFKKLNTFNDILKYIYFVKSHVNLINK